MKVSPDDLLWLSDKEQERLGSSSKINEKVINYRGRRNKWNEQTLYHSYFFQFASPSIKHIICSF